MFKSGTSEGGGSKLAFDFYQANIGGINPLTLTIGPVFLSLENCDQTTQCFEWA
jgi:hypothetical protein